MPDGPPTHTSQLAEKRRARLWEVVAGLESLPTSAAVPMRVLRLKQSGTAGMPEIADALMADAGLAAKLLSLANSAAFAHTHKVTRLSQAVGMIGLKNLMPLVFGLSLGGLFNKLTMRSEDRAAFFQVALLKACTARAVAGVTAPELAEEAFLCGLMQDVALPVVLASDRAAWPETAAALDLYDPAARLARETQLCGTDHAALGRRVIERLALPEPFPAAVGLHHAGVEPLTAAVGGGLARAVDAAAAVPHRLAGGSARALQPLASKLRSIAGGPDAAGVAERVLAEAADQYAGMTKAFGTADESGGAFKRFLHEVTAEVARTMAEAVCESHATIAGLQVRQTGLVREVEDLRQQVLKSELDGLTGVLTRAAFLRRVPMLLDAARGHGVEVYIGFADIDDFKRVNDAHGHAVGDAAIRAVAGRLAAVARGTGLVGRMGGDEFAFLIVNKGGATAAHVAARLAEQFGPIPVAAGGATVAVTASTGLLDVGVPRPQDTADDVLARADRLMYEVKRSGKGRCLSAAAVTVAG